MCGRTRAPGSAWVAQQGQQCEVHRDSLAHAHKTIGRSPHRLPSRGNPGILLYANDMTSASASGRHTLGAGATGISVQLIGSSRSPTSSVPIIRFRIGPEMTRLTSRHADQGSYAICRAELGYKPGLRHYHQRGNHGRPIASGSGRAGEPTPAAVQEAGGVRQTTQHAQRTTKSSSEYANRVVRGF